jgi:subtilisin family serine protease
MYRKISIFGIILLMIGAAWLIPVGAADKSHADENNNINDSVGAIVVFKDAPTNGDVEHIKGLGAVVKYSYNKVVHGAAIDMSQKTIDKVNKACKGKTPDISICQNIKYIEKDGLVYASARPKPVPTAQPIPWGVDHVNAPSAWATSRGTGVKVAVVDTGIDTTHPDLAANIKGGVSFVTRVSSYKDDNGHGTHVAGIIAAINNTIGVVGVAPNAQLYSVKVLDRTGSGTVSSVIAGIDWSAKNGMQVISMSLGTNTDFQSLHDAVDRAYLQGVVVVAAAGNDYGGPISYPAAYDNVIAVTATDSNNKIASFSNIGPQAEIAAPGVNIYSTYKGGGYATLSGTSMSTPFVSGEVADVLATPVNAVYDINHNGRWDPVEVRNKLHNKSTDLGNTGFDIKYGYGLANVYAAVN